MNYQRSLALTNVFRHAPQIFGMGSSVEFDRKYNRAEDPQFASLIGSKLGVISKKPALEMPFMFPDGDLNAALIFRSHTVARVRARLTSNTVHRADLGFLDDAGLPMGRRVHPYEGSRGQATFRRQMAIARSHVRYDSSSLHLCKALFNAICQTLIYIYILL